MSERELIAIEQKDVEFYGDLLVAIRADDGRIYAVLSHMCDILGLDGQGQRRRIGRHSVMAKGLGWVDILSTQGQQSQRRRVAVLRNDLIPLWLAGIRANMVSDDIRGRLIQLQENAATVLWEAFQSGRLTQEHTLPPDSPAMIALEIAKAAYELAQNQVFLEAQLSGVTIVLKDHDQRLEAIESQLGDTGRLITTEQQAQISQAVKAVAIAYGNKTGRNEFGGVYGELYREFDISGYKQLPASRFHECMQWLTDWLNQLNE